MGASFHEVEFPRTISYGATGGPGFKTTVLALASGFEKRNIDWSMARAQYDVSHAVKTQADLNILIAFFYARRGKAYGFRFFDWLDNAWSLDGTPQPCAVALPNNGGVQLCKVYSDTAGSYTRYITKPIQGTMQFYVNGSASSGVTVDYTTGLLTGVTDPTKVTCTGQFHVPVRFDTDDMKASIDDWDSNSWRQITLVEVRDI